MIGWNIHEITLSGDKRNVYLVGDVHTGADTTDYEAFNRMVEAVRKDNYADVFLLGDLLELAMKPHMQREQTIPPHLQMAKFVEMIQPIKNKIKIVLEGNHEKRVTKLVGLDYLKDALMPHCKNAAFLGYEGFVRYRLKCGASTLIYLHHGVGSSTTEHYLLDKAVRNGLDIADFIVIAHGHKTHTKEYVRWQDCGETIEARTVYGIRTGSYLSHAQYAKNHFYTAGRTCCTVLEIGKHLGVKHL